LLGRDIENVFPILKFVCLIYVDPVPIGPPPALFLLSAIVAPANNAAK
jgi:hypothetical protein